MIQILQQLVTSVSVGGLYALLAVGYALIYSVFDFTKLAFGGIMMVSAFAGYFATKLGVPTAAAMLVASAAGVLISVAVELLAYRPMRKRNANRLFLMISAMGVNIFITNLFLCLFGANLRALPTGFSSNTIALGPLRIGVVDLLSLIVSVVALVLLTFFLYRTRAGVTVRASALDMSTAGLMGIDVNRVSLIVFAISGITAAIAGMFFGMKYNVYPAMGSISNKAFIASVIGGLGSLKGAVIGGFLLGILEIMVTAYISATYRDLVSFAVMMIVLIFLPNGLFGMGDQNKL
ncbi:MAG: branched-chain amino acid ABC transporter permease [Clostridiales bacterium]|nr:branched-chain amino acid ABC transporter permease [Candidatus Apopatocola equi]